MDMSPTMKETRFEDWTIRFWRRENERDPPEIERGQWDRETNQQDEDVPRVRWCVATQCEMKKCQRMVMEFNYRLNSASRWSCTMAPNKEACMRWIHMGYADIMTAESEGAYKAGKVHHLIPIMYEKMGNKHVKNYDLNFAKFHENNGELRQFSVALVKKTDLNISNFTSLYRSKSCHGSVDQPALFKNPVCSLIYKDVIPKVGNVYESAGEFFKSSCVPGVQSQVYNPNMTNPESLCGICQGESLHPMTRAPPSIFFLFSCYSGQRHRVKTWTRCVFCRIFGLSILSIFARVDERSGKLI